MSDADAPAATASTEAPQKRGGPGRDLANWHPPEEPGDDSPILAAGAAPKAETPRAEAPKPEMRAEAPKAAEAPRREQPRDTPRTDVRDAPRGDVREAPRGDEGPTDEEPGVDYAVVFVDVGRRDGARPADFQRILRDRGGISRRETGRIRVRDKHALVSVRREILEKAIAALAGAEIAGRVARAEPARERPQTGEEGLGPPWRIVPVPTIPRSCVAASNSR